MMQQDRALLKKKATFNCTTACQDAFEHLKSGIVSESCLRYSDLHRPFMLPTDCCKPLLVLF